MRTVLFVPGYPENIKSRDYSHTLKAIENHGYNVEFVQIEWKRKTIDQWVTQLDEVYSRYDPSNTILAGFSYGAMTALVSAVKCNPSELWLFSLSPYFAEDIISVNMKKTWLKNIGHRRVSAFSKLNFEQIAKSIKCKILLFSGQLELDAWPVMAERTFAADRLLPNSTLNIISGVGHDVTHKEYITAIESMI